MRFHSNNNSDTFLVSGCIICAWVSEISGHAQVTLSQVNIKLAIEKTHMSLMGHRILVLLSFLFRFFASFACFSFR